MVAEVIGNSADKDLGKVLMESLAAEWLPGESDPMAVYRLYLRSSLSANIAHGRLALLEGSLLAEFYRLDDPLAKPKSFDFFRSSDISRLEESMALRIVILRECGRGRYHKLHDKRIYDDASEISWPQRLFVLRKERGTKYSLLRGPPDYDVRLSEFSFIASCAPPELTCLLPKLKYLLGRPPGTCDHTTGGDGRTCVDPLALLLHAKETREELGAPILLASHVRGMMRSWKPSLALEEQSFAVLGVARREDELLSDCTVICVTADKKHAYLPLESVRRKILERATVRRSEKRERLPPQEVSPTRGDSRTGSGNFTRDRVLGSDGCACGPCERGKDFENNMEKAGRQKLYRTRPSSFDYARMFGLLDPETERALNEACRLSLGGFDVESLTLEAPRDEGYLPRETVSGVSRGRTVLARQVPIYISWSDYRMDKEGEAPLAYEYDEARPEDTARKFVADLLAMRERAIEAKKVLLAPLLSWLEALERAHLAHFLGGEDDEIPSLKRQKAVVSGWANNPWGRFQKSLLSLQRRYLIFGFNAEVSLDYSRKQMPVTSLARARRDTIS